MLRGTREEKESVFRLNERENQQNRDGQQVSSRDQQLYSSFLQEDRFYSKPEKQQLSLKRCTVGGEEKGS